VFRQVADTTQGHSASPAGTQLGIQMQHGFRRCGSWRWAALLRWLALFCLVLPAPAFAGPTGVGFSAIEVKDPVNGGDMAGYVFYPSASAAGITDVGPYELAATAEAAAVPGAKPLVVFSHGHGGSDLGHHDLATFLARHGFIVATITHPRDNYRDSSGDGRAVVMGGRPIQISATISYLLQSRRWKPLVDPGRIGVAGFSNGGYTSLLLVGAEPSFADIPGHCKRHPDDRNLCVPFARMEAESGQNHRTAGQAIEELEHGLHQWGSTSDPRVKAAFVMAPFSAVFDSAGLAHVDRPVFLYYAEDDEVLLPRYNALHIAPLIGSLAGLEMVPDAGHYIFLSPCSPALAEEEPDICQDPAGTDRIAVHRRIDADALMFFENALHVASG
jgi:predicted dienelactone hydrolase